MHVPASPEIAVREDRRAIDRALESICEAQVAPIATTSPSVAEAVQYSLLGGGKRLRGVLLLASHRAAGGSGDATGLAAGIEVVHAYSLVHDDLPCMDDDDIRRGRPTVHRVHGVSVATIAGLTMVPLAVRVLIAGAGRLGLSSAIEGRIVTEVMRASGAGGMIGGQLLDLQGEGSPLALEEMQRVHRAKTGALIAASAVVGALAASVDEDIVAAFGRFGEAVGLAFQIADDVLDVTASTDVLGKTAGRDVTLRKSTYPALLGVDGARARARMVVETGCAALVEHGMLTEELRHLARFAIDRPS